MTIEATKEDLVNLLTGNKPNSMVECDALTKTNIMRFTGNQWNEDWDFVRETLTKLTEVELYSLYQNIKMLNKLKV